MSDKIGALEQYGPKYPETRDLTYSKITGGEDLQKYPLAALGAYGFPIKRLGYAYEAGTHGTYDPRDDRVGLAPYADFGTALHEFRHRAVENTPEMSYLDLARPEYRTEEWRNRLFDALVPNGNSAARAQVFSREEPGREDQFLKDQVDPKQLSALMLMQAIADAKNVQNGNPRSYNQYPEDIYEKVHALTGLRLGPSTSGKRFGE